MSSQQAIAERPVDAGTAPDPAPTHLLSPYHRGQFALKNRLVMSPMTRRVGIFPLAPKAAACWLMSESMMHVR